MIVINAQNVNDALHRGMDVILNEGKSVDSRGGNTLEAPCPVATVYQDPRQKVLINKIRDANPFFHLMESLWILAGRQDVKFLTEFNKRMGDYSDDGEVFNAPYGYRLRTRFFDSGNCDLDQLQSVIKILHTDPNSRQAVCQIWDTEDLDKDTKDKACNMSIVFRIRNNKLCMTVYNRSNDMIWGAYGANVVQFSMIQEYVSAHLNVAVGTYTQVSNSYHVYAEGPGGAVWDRLVQSYDSFDPSYVTPYDKVKHMVLMQTYDIGNIESDIKTFFNVYDDFGLEELGEINCWQSDYFKNLIAPMINLYIIYKKVGPEKTLPLTDCIIADDWRMACFDWLQNRIEAKAK